MDIQTTKIALVKQILDIDAPELIEKIVNLITKEKKDFWEELSESQREEIEIADLQVLNEETTDYEAFMSSHRK
jgi:hypothetical protein